MAEEVKEKNQFTKDEVKDMMSRDKTLTEAYGVGNNLYSFSKKYASNSKDKLTRKELLSDEVYRDKKEDKKKK